MRPNLSLVTLGVHDLQRSLMFYRDGLGFTTDSKIEDGVLFFNLSGVVLGLWSRELLAADAGVKDDGSGFRGISIAHNARSKEEVDEIFATLKTMKAWITKMPEKTFWGGYSGYFADPDGHLWEVAFNPFWTLDEHGRIAKL